ncbi:unnamed protein product [Rotaria socialis]|uniref:Uncharacterized protein n=1 Tax=Rotaria socialis TaxID=392032 RepID=A0A817U488_9BILA|nr:unnamed protein product [Rotaria socialis]CAF4662242.1 unnamed protein product [Rotaria socialis]
MNSRQIIFDITSYRPLYGPREIPFTRIAHSTHRKDKLIKMLRTVSDNGPGIHFKGKKHDDYGRLPVLSWWGIIPDKDSMLGHPVAHFNSNRSNTFKRTNRYGPICFSIPLKNVPGEFYCGGTRTFTHEYAHTTIININKACIPEIYPKSKFRRDSEVDDRNTALYSIIPKKLIKTYGNNHYLWRCYRWGNSEDPKEINYQWDHPEFAIVAGKDGFDFTAAQGLRIHFVDHKKALCVKSKSPYDEICDMCWTAKEACTEFVHIIHENGMIFENFQPFFEQEIWNKLVMVKDKLYKSLPDFDEIVMDGTE